MEDGEDDSVMRGSIVFGQSPGMELRPLDDNFASERDSSGESLEKCSRQGGPERADPYKPCELCEDAQHLNSGQEGNFMQSNDDIRSNIRGDHSLSHDASHERSNDAPNARDVELSSANQLSAEQYRRAEG